ncbi:MAG: SpoIIE family protein phosphatase, partial [Flammeovirgaceae bacterium]
TMIEQSVREQTNLEIGRLAFRNNSEEYISEWICDIANYYNSGANLVEDENEILQLVTINHRAGLKAKRSTAYEAALRYFQTGIDNLLRAYDWNNQYELAFNLTKNFAECCYLLTRFDAAEAAFSQLLMNSKTVTEKGEILIMMSSLYSNTLKFEDALATCKKAVSQLGFDVPDGQEATQKAFAAELEKIESLRQEKGYQDMGDLVHAEPIKDQNTLYALNACLQGWASAYMCNDFDTVFWLAAKITSISLEFGVAPESAYGVLAQGIYLSNVTGDYNQGYEYGKTGLAINERFNDMSLKTPINHLMGTFVGFWKLPLRENFQFFKQAYESGMITGNYTYTGYAHAVKTRHAYFMGEPLQELAEECNRSVTVLSKIKMESMIALMSPNYALIKCLLGETESATTIDCDIFNEKTYLENVGQIPIYLAVLYPLKSRMFFYAKEYQKGIENYELAVPNMVALFGTIWNVFHNLNGSLNLAGLCHEQLNPAHLDKIKENQTQMKVWADTCPNNFMHQYILIEAEVANLEGNYLEAMDFYDKAISLAQENNFIDDEALANELAGEFYIKIQKKHIAALYMKRAHYAYSMWGAKTKMEDLEHTYPLLLERTNLTYTIESTQTVSPMTTNQTIASTTHLGGSLDLNTLLKATQAITGEIKLENLLDKLLRIVAENAGADQVYLVLNNKKEFRIEASYSIDEKESSVLQSIPLDEETDDLPTGIINYALRSRKDVILNDASKEGQFQHNAYVEKYAPKSVLAGLIWKRGDIRAVLYLENKQTSGVFTAKRVELLSMLSSQIVISIDNALLYQNTENLVEERTIELREKNKRITDSIMYAETIQGAILPDKEDFESFFADHFVIYRPKDIVSGDFYWLNEVNGSAVLACIDCTGHGVPGAFMSMIGNTLLDEIVIQKQHTDPAAILSLLHKNIRTALKQESGQNTDGMDMSICVFTKTGEGKYRLDFAGAKRAIWVTKDREFEVVTGDRKSIGGFQKEVERKFNTKTLELSSGDMVYQFTDGFADQNNPDMKRFGSKRLRQLISSYTKIPLPKQRELLENNFDVFRAGEPQRDDITLMAIQL